MSTQPHVFWARLVLAGLARMTLIGLGGLLAWSVLPFLVGWQPTVVMSGSMEPRIGTGDVVVTHTIQPQDLRPGHVLLVDDPAQQGKRLLHRLERFTPDGELILRGDANAAPDSTPVPRDDVHGVGTLRIPWVGRPVVWLAGGQYLPVAGTVLGLVALLVLARVREYDTGDGPDGPDGPRSDDAAAAAGSATAPRSTASTVACVAMMLAVTGLFVAAPASATFGARTGTAAALQARTVDAAPAACTDLGTAIRLSWTKTAADYVYKVTIDGVAESSFRTDVDNGDPVGTTQGVKIPARLLSSVLGRDIDVRVTTNLRDTPGWQHSTTVPAHVALLGLGISCR